MFVRAAKDIRAIRSAGTGVKATVTTAYPVSRTFLTVHGGGGVVLLTRRDIPSHPPVVVGEHPVAARDRGEQFIGPTGIVFVRPFLPGQTERRPRHLYGSVGSLAHLPPHRLNRVHTSRIIHRRTDRQEPF